MKIAVGTNILVRAVTFDDLPQAKAAMEAIRSAESVVISLPVLCELVWVLESKYGFTTDETTEAVQSVAEAKNVDIDMRAVAAGLKMIEQGGDFTDGVIAYEGERLGADVFVSFDRKAVRLLSHQGSEAYLLHSAES